MYAVGIRELKAKLSEYVRMAKNGHVVLVTDRGHVVAELRAPTVQLPEPEGDRLDEMVQSGALQRARHHRQDAYRRSELSLEEGTARAILQWMRGDGGELDER